MENGMMQLGQNLVQNDEFISLQFLGINLF
jgi:hypothetical protein